MAVPAKPLDIWDAFAEFYADPLGFVFFAFPWGEGGLKGQDGPDEWQVEVLRELGRGSISAQEAVRIAIASGHGIGKTALVAWIILWFIATRAHPQIVVTSNTKPQLETKTWRELSKWHKLMLGRDEFEWTATKFYMRANPETWFAAAITWSKERSEAFAGTHEENVLVIFDEASLIDDAIWEVAEGAMTTPGAFWVAFGNPTRNTGRFRECFGRFRHRWTGKQIDSRTAKMANKAEIDRWIEDYGDDSDFVRVRVKGQFPRASSLQFIGVDLVEAAAGRHVREDQYNDMPRIIGVDVARFGDDQSVIIRRQGLASWTPRKFREVDNMALVGLILQEIETWRPDAVFIDAGGGTGVIDRLRQLGHHVIEVHFGAEATDKQHYRNKRAEMWGRTRDWLKAGGAIANDQDLRADLIGPEYGFTDKDQIQLERKEDMKARGLASPDCGDALALTFAYHVDRIEDYGRGAHTRMAKTDYDPMEGM